MGNALVRCLGLLRPREPSEPRLDRGQRTHEAACLQELPTPAAASRQITVKGLLIDLVHMEETIGCAFIKDSVLDVLAQDTRALLIAASKEIGAGMIVIVRALVRVLVFVAVL